MGVSAVCNLHHHMHETKDPITSLLMFSLSSERCQALVGSLQVAHPGCIAGYNMVRFDYFALLLRTPFPCFAHHFKLGSQQSNDPGS